MKTFLSACVIASIIALFSSCSSVIDFGNQLNNKAGSGKTINIVSPLANDYAADIVSIQATLNGISLDEINKVELFIGGTLKATYTLPPFNYTWDTTGVPDGPITIKFKVTLNTTATIENSINVNVQKGIFVSTTGNDFNPGTKAAPLLSIQKAVNNAVELGTTTIYIAQGTYTPGIGLNAAGSGVRITNDNLKLIGGYSSDFSVRTGISDLNGNNTLYHIFDCQDVNNLTIDSFIVRNGNANSTGWNNSAGGVMWYGITNGKMTNVIIINNYGTYVGGMEFFAGYNCDLSVTVTNNVNSASCGGLFVQNCLNTAIRGNISFNATTGGYAGGLYLSGCSNVTVTASINFNSSTTYGGGVAVDISTNCIFIGCTVNTNNSPTGGGFSIANSSNIIIQDSVISSNTGTSGGGIYFVFSSYQLANDVLQWNHAPSVGGGIYVNQSSGTISASQLNNNFAVHGGGIYINTAPSLSMTGCTMNNNTVGGQGGGVWILSSPGVSLKGCSVNSNSGGDNGGGIYANSSALQITNSSVSYNSTSGSAFGGGIYFLTVQSTIKNSVLDYNRAPSGGGGALMIYGTSVVELNACDISGNSAQNIGGIYWFINNYSLSIIGCTLTNDYGSGALNYIIALQPNGTHTNMIISNNVIAGTNGSSTYGISEYSANLTGQTIVNNTFITNKLGFLYLDLGGYGNITCTSTWTNINAPLYTGAAVAYGNTVTMQ